MKDLNQINIHKYKIRRRQCKNFSHPYLVSDLRVDFLVYHTREMANFKQIQRFVSKIKCPDPGKLVKLCSYQSWEGEPKNSWVLSWVELVINRAYLSWVELSSSSNSTQLMILVPSSTQLNSLFSSQLNSTQLTFSVPTQLNSAQLTFLWVAEV